MRILWHMPVLRVSGCGLSGRAVRFAQELIGRGHELTFVVRHDPSSDNAPTIHGFSVIRISVTKRDQLHWSLQSRARTRAAQGMVRALSFPHELFISCQPEVVSAYKRRFPTSPVLFVCGGTTLLHDAAARSDQRRLPVWRRLPFQLDRFLKHVAERTAFRVADGVIFDSKSTMQLVSHRYGLLMSHLHAIPAGVDFARFQPPRSNDRGAARKNLGLADDAIVLAWTGRLSPEKNLGQLFAAMSQCRQRIDCVLLVGDGPQRLELEAQSRQPGIAGKVRFAGTVADVRPFLHAADLFVFPSAGESFGCSLVEAMACGLPCVAFRSGRTIRTAADEIFDGGRCGFLANSDRPGSLAATLDRALSDPDARRRIGRAAAEHAARCYDWTKAGRAFCDIAESLGGRATTVGLHRSAMKDIDSSVVPSDGNMSAMRRLRPVSSNY